jgi:mono/diheme cytochrome c family protein
MLARNLALFIGIAALALSACNTQGVESTSSQAATSAQAAPQAPASGFVRRGDSFAMMSEQYAPRPSRYAATGASAWVPAAPPPAFVATGPLPAAGPEAPIPAAVANRQPATPAPAAPASELARPEAAAPTPDAAPARDPAVRTAGLALFNANGCGNCHLFPDANAFGEVGPPLDRGLMVRTIVNTLNDGRGAMPSFKGAMSDAEILALANYIAQYGR